MRGTVSAYGVVIFGLGSAQSLYILGSKRLQGMSPSGLRYAWRAGAISRGGIPDCLCLELLAFARLVYRRAFAKGSCNTLGGIIVFAVCTMLWSLRALA